MQLAGLNNESSVLLLRCFQWNCTWLQNEPALCLDERLVFIVSLGCAKYCILGTSDRAPVGLLLFRDIVCGANKGVTLATSVGALMGLILASNMNMHF